MPVKTNIGEGANIRKDTATESDVLSGMTFHAGKSQKQRTGTMADKSGTTQSATASLDTTNNRVQMTVPATGKYSTASKLYTTYAAIRTLIGLTASVIATGTSILGIAGTYTGLGDASASDVLTGKTFSTASLSNAAGTMVDKTGTTQSATASLDSTNSRVQMKIPATGKYNTSSYLYATYSTIASLIGLTAAKIATGTSILGITGSYKGVGTATAAQVLKGYTFSSASLSGASGSMTNKSGTTQSAEASLDTTYSRLQLTVPATGYYDTSAKLYAAYSTIRTLIGLTAANLAYGKTCLGLTGTYKPTVKQLTAYEFYGFTSTGADDGSLSADPYTCPADGYCYYDLIITIYGGTIRPVASLSKNGEIVRQVDGISGNVYSTDYNWSVSVVEGDVISVSATAASDDAKYMMAYVHAVIVTY